MTTAVQLPTAAPWAAARLRRVLGRVLVALAVGALVVAVWHARGPAEPVTAPEAPGRPAPA